MKTSDAFKTIFRCICIIAINTCKSINSLVYKYPWAFIIVISIAAVIISCVNIGSARSERDNTNAKMIKMQQQMDTMQCIIDNKNYKYGIKH